jgi:hypothetical protein
MTHSGFDDGAPNEADEGEESGLEGADLDAQVPPPLHLVGADHDESPAPSDYEPEVEMRRAWRALQRNGRDGAVAGHVTHRLAAMLAAWWWPLRHGDDVWVMPRRSDERPPGGILRPLESPELRQRATARFAERCPDEPIPSGTTLNTAFTRFAGAATSLARSPQLRWGRGADGALWWDAGRADGACVRIGKEGWSVEDQPGCWFRRSDLIRPMPLPEPGGDLDDLWEFVRVEPADRPLVVAWMLAQTQPETERAAGLLYITGPAGGGKTTAARCLTRVCGDRPEPRSLADEDRANRNMFVASAAGWTVWLDNLSVITAEQSDTLCTMVTGRTEIYRRLHTDTATVTLDVGRPVLATAVEVPVLRPDLITRMLPVEVEADRGGRVAEDTLLAAFSNLQPRMFGALLSLLSATTIAPEPSVDLPRLAVLGRMAAQADAIRGTDTLSRLRHRQALLLADTVADDPFFGAVRATIRDRFVGSATELLELLDPNGDLGRTWRGQWPSPKAVSSRLKRHEAALRQAGWVVACSDNGHKGRTWELVAPVKFE